MNKKVRQSLKSVIKRAKQFYMLLRLIWWVFDFLDSEQ